MDVKEAIETLKDPTEWYEDELTLKLKYAKAKDMAIEALERTRWIPVGERLPIEKDGYVLAVWNEADVVTMQYADVQMYSDYHSANKITHWMLLPNPPEVE